MTTLMSILGSEQFYYLLLIFAGVGSGYIYGQKGKE